MKTSTQLLKFLVASLAITGCDKSGNSFSVLSGSSAFQQQTVFEPRKLDVLFVVDNSGSMRTSQDSLANNFSSFIDRFVSKGYNFKIAITTTDAFYGDQFLGYSSAGNGTPCSLCNVNQTRFRSGVVPTPVFVIDSNNFDLLLPSEINRLKEEFSSNVRVGVSGSGDERAFSSFKAALSSSLNAGFHRPDAFLSVVIISDEEDYSQGISMPGATGFSTNETYTNPIIHPVMDYKNFLSGFTNGISGKDYSVSTISIQDSVCQLSLGSGRKIGNRYKELADLTGGSINSLCAPFDTSLDNISTTVAGQVTAEFKLNKKPIVNSIRLIIDGIVIPESSTSGWSYEAIENKIVINGSEFLPKFGSSIIITFDPDLTGGQ